MKNYCIIFLIVILLVTYSVTARRSKFRKKDPTIPEITIGWKGSPKRITRTDWHYNEYPIFTTFNEHFFYTHMLPQGSISPRCEGKQSIECMQLASLIEELLKELKKKRKNMPILPCYVRVILMLTKNVGSLFSNLIIIPLCSNYL